MKNFFLKNKGNCCWTDGAGMTHYFVLVTSAVWPLRMFFFSIRTDTTGRSKHAIQCHCLRFLICTDYIQSCILFFTYKAPRHGFRTFFLSHCTFLPQSRLRLVSLLKVLITEHSAATKILTTTASSCQTSFSRRFPLYLPVFSFTFVCTETLV